mmetsp:Transcript_3078/g.9053  ORF Transcript_3078/g.9053 Transcript_3078/m.9053 type:complete len:283 (+) Transcript_3078:485-1333(+)
MVRAGGRAARFRRGPYDMVVRRASRAMGDIHGGHHRRVLRPAAHRQRPRRLLPWRGASPPFAHRRHLCGAHGCSVLLAHVVCSRERLCGLPLQGARIHPDHVRERVRDPPRRGSLVPRGHHARAQVARPPRRGRRRCRGHRIPHWRLEDRGRNAGRRSEDDARGADGPPPQGAPFCGKATAAQGEEGGVCARPRVRACAPDPRVCAAGERLGASPRSFFRQRAPGSRARGHEHAIAVVRGHESEHAKVGAELQAFVRQLRRRPRAAAARSGARQEQFHLLQW